MTPQVSLLRPSSPPLSPAFASVLIMRWSASLRSKRMPFSSSPPSRELKFLHLEKLQCLPEGLHRISSLKTLEISCCRDFESLPKCSLPSSLQNLKIGFCPAFKSLPKDSLPSSLQYLKIDSCRALKSLPKDGLPSLRELDVHRGNSEALMRQCRKLKGTIPIIRD